MSKYFVRRDECARHNIFPGVEIFTMAGQQVMLSYVTFEPNSVVESHSHPHEQIGILLEGELWFAVGEEEQMLQPGDTWRIPGGVEHRAVAGDKPVRALDVFHPVRDDYA